MKLIAVGACYLDTILSVDHYPGEDEKLRASSISQRRGGNCPNSLEVLQQLVELEESPPLLLNLIAVLPSNSSVGSRQIRSSFGPQVNLQGCIYRELCSDPASSYIIKSLSTGSRTIVNYNALPEMTTDEFAKIADELASPTSWFHFEGRIPETTRECIKYLRETHPKASISVEVEKPGRSGLQELAANADVIFYSRGWAMANGYQSPEECLRRQAKLTPQASFSCCTWGEGGAAILDFSNMSCLHTPAYKHANLPVVDTIGAGDTFIAGVLYSLTCHPEDWDLERKIQFSNRLAGFKVTQDGFSGVKLFIEKSSLIAG